MLLVRGWVKDSPQWFFDLSDPRRKKKKRDGSAEINSGSLLKYDAWGGWEKTKINMREGLSSSLAAAAALVTINILR